MQIALESMARDKGPLGSGSPFLGLKYWRMDIFPQNWQRQCLLCTKAIAYVYFTCVYVALCKPRVKNYGTENFAALNIRNKKKNCDIYFRNSSGVRNEFYLENFQNYSTNTKPKEMYFPPGTNYYAHILVCLRATPDVIG